MARSKKKSSGRKPSRPCVAYNITLYRPPKEVNDGNSAEGEDNSADGGKPKVQVFVHGMFNVTGGDSTPNAQLSAVSQRHSVNVLPVSLAANMCTTIVEPLHLSQQWKIENFSSVMKLALPGNCLRSSIFRDAALPDACWQLCLYPGGKRQENANHVSLFLKMSATSPNKEVRIKVEYRFYFLNEYDMPVFSNVNVGEFHAKPPKGGHSWGLRNIPKQKVVNCVHDDGSLVVSCEIELIPDISKIKCLSTKDFPVTPTTVVSREFVECQESAFENGCMVDCNIEVCGTVIPVSKFVLCAHSKVFRAMFSYADVRENKEKRVVIVDTDVESVKMMLHYMYCGEVDVQNNAAGVLVLAERYQMDELKRMCEQKLCFLVDKDNLFEMLHIADLFNCKQLLATVVETFRLNKAVVMVSSGWESLKHSDPMLANEVMEQVMLCMDSPSPPPIKRQRYHHPFTFGNGV